MSRRQQPLLTPLWTENSDWHSVSSFLHFTPPHPVGAKPSDFALQADGTREWSSPGSRVTLQSVGTNKTTDSAWYQFATQMFSTTAILWNDVPNLSIGNEQEFNHQLHQVHNKHTWSFKHVPVHKKHSPSNTSCHSASKL
eukprot:scaffold26019_cov147-Cylindrotheca_fusiformis.AAC.3